MAYKSYHPEKGIINEPSVEIHASGLLVINRELAELALDLEDMYGFLGPNGRETVRKKRKLYDFQILVDEQERKIALTFKHVYFQSVTQIELREDGSWCGCVGQLLGDFDWLKPGIYEPKRNRSQQWELRFKQNLFDIEPSSTRLLPKSTQTQG